MYILDIVLSQGIAEKLGWTLIHSLWQTVIIALGLAMLLRSLRRASAHVRYLVACLALIMTLAFPLMTSGLLSFSDAAPSVQGQPMSAPAVEPSAASTAETGQLETAQSRQVRSEWLPSGIWKPSLLIWIEPELPLLVCFWAVGVLGLSVWHLGGWLRLHGLRRTGTRPVDQAIRDHLTALGGQLGIRRAVQCLESAKVHVPTLVGWLRPVILLPASVLTGLSPGALEALLAHELAHVKRYDYLVNLIQTAVEILAFYHPGVWWISNRIRVEREHCCDDMAIAVCQDRAQYMRALARMEEIRSQPARLAVAANGGHLLTRIQRLAGISPSQSRTSVWLSGLVTVSLVMTLTLATGLAVGDYATDPDMALEREVLKGFSKNRDRLQCGTLTWTEEVERSGSGQDGQKRTLTGQYQMWWDGKKLATKYDRDILCTGTPNSGKSQEWWIERQRGSNAYDGSPLSFKPKFDPREDWLRQVQWKGRGSVDEQIKHFRKTDHLKVEWAKVDVNDRLLIRLTVRNMSTETPSDGGHSVDYFDPTRGYGLVKTQWYSRENGLYLERNADLAEVVPGGWLPVQILSESFLLAGGEAGQTHRFRLDLDRCSFNDRSALPDGIFKYSVKSEQQELNATLKAISDEEDRRRESESQALRQGPAASVQAFLDAALAGDLAKARSYLAPRMAQANDGDRSIKQFKEMAQGQNLRIAAVAAEKGAAFVVTSAMKADQGRTGPLTFQLIAGTDEPDRWYIQDIDIKTPAKAGRDLEAFLEKHPNGRLLLMEEHEES